MKQLLNKYFGQSLPVSEPLWEYKESPKVDTITLSYIEKQNAIVQEIHDTFYSEVDRLLTEAGIKVSSATDKQDLIDKSYRLQKLGFRQTVEVSAAIKEEIRINTAEKVNTEKQDLIDAINYFSFKYPQYKFITEESVKKICQKYGLIYGEVSLYKGEVPDKNMEDIEKFSIKEEDCPYFVEPDWRFITFMGERQKNTAIDYTRHIENKKTLDEHYLSNGIIVDKDGLLVSTDDIDPRVKYGSMNWSELQELQRKVGKIAPLEIAAPLKDFDTSGMEVNDFKLSKIEVPDPVVLHPVMFKGVKHYLIVTCWGLEATDELVVNQRNN